MWQCYKITDEDRGERVSKLSLVSLISSICNFDTVTELNQHWTDSSRITTLLSSLNWTRFIIDEPYTVIELNWINTELTGATWWHHCLFRALFKAEFGSVLYLTFTDIKMCTLCYYGNTTVSRTILRHWKTVSQNWKNGPMQWWKLHLIKVNGVREEGISLWDEFWMHTTVKDRNE